MALPAEFELMLACCRWPRSPTGDEAVRAAAAGVDWARLDRMAARHRVGGLVHDALRRADVEPSAPVAAHLAADATGVARRNLIQAAEALRLSGRLQRAGLPHLFVKGVTLNLLAYGTLALKQTSDIDLLVEPDAYQEACRILEEDGYRCTHPGEQDVATILRYAAAAKDSVWRSPDDAITVELHQRLTANPLLLPSLGARSPSQQVAVGPGVSLPTLARPELFAYLCVHGALTAWSRLKWLADLAAFVAGEDARGIEDLYRAAVEIAPGRAPAQALLLANRLLGVPLTEPLAAELRSDRMNRYLERAAIATMTGGGAVKELEEQPFASARLSLAVLMLQPGWKYKATELGRKVPHIPRAVRGAINAVRGA